MDYNHTGYNRVFNNFGLAALNKPIDMPDAALGIGFAEVLAPVRPVAYMPAVHNPQIPAHVDDITDTTFTGQGNPIKADSFTRSGWLGAAIGGF